MNIKEDVWTHVFQDSEETYINGELKHPHLSPVGREVLERLSEANKPLGIPPGGSGGYWIKGSQVASVRVYNRPLSEAEIRELFNESRAMFGV